MNIKRILAAIKYGGTSSLKPLEKVLLDEFAKIAILHDAEALQEQMNGIFIIQRNQKNRMILFFLDKEIKYPLFKDVRENLCLAKIKYEIDSNKYETKIYSHRGLISSLETSSELPNDILKKEPKILSSKLLSTVSGSISQELDELEHG
jgi:hypothetical protein